jgi:hypothetical protein
MRGVVTGKGRGQMRGVTGRGAVTGRGRGRVRGRGRGQQGATGRGAVTGRGRGQGRGQQGATGRGAVAGRGVVRGARTVWMRGGVRVRGSPAIGARGGARPGQARYCIVCTTTAAGAYGPLVLAPAEGLGVLRAPPPKKKVVLFCAGKKWKFSTIKCNF